MKNSLEEVRAGINEVDKKIVKLLAERSGLVQAAAGFKSDTESVKATDRVEQVIAKVRTLALENETDPDVIEGIYRAMIKIFTESEMKEFKANQ